MKASLHDELMREAGFESDYYAELARRRVQSRRIALRVARRIAPLVVVVACGIDLGHRFMPGLPQWAISLAIAIFVSEIFLDWLREGRFDWLAERLPWLRERL